MNTESEINNKIISLVNEIKDKYPELAKYIAEIPVKDVFKDSSEISNKNLLDYYNTLKTIFDKYAAEHAGYKKK